MSITLDCVFVIYHVTVCWWAQYSVTYHSTSIQYFAGILYIYIH